MLIDDKHVYDHGSFHSLGSPRSTSQFRLKIKAPPFVFFSLPPSPEWMNILWPPRLWSAIVALYFVTEYSTNTLSCWLLNLPSDSRAPVGDCCAPSPKQDELGVPSLVPPVET